MTTSKNDQPTEAPALSPGTVSKILWHFTGGPSWNPAARRQNTAPKPAARAYANLKSILRSKVLRLGGYKEVVKVVVPDRRRRIGKSKNIEVVRMPPVTLESEAVCCVSDIPAPHLRYHAYRYGKFAIGFHRDALIGAGFNPVFYTLHDTPIVRSVHRGLSSLEFTGMENVLHVADKMEWALDESALATEIEAAVDDLRDQVEWIETDIEKALSNVKQVLAFIKTFDRTEFTTIYCEREWRSTEAFNFSVDDVAMVVIPKEVGGQRYFRSFVERMAPRLRLPRRVTVVAWDDLVEH
jgi:hypothetical protein